jgi:hypothetical protein
LIATAYDDFFDVWVPLMAGVGITGAAQYCLDDACPAFDYYGFNDQGGKEKPYTKNWFKTGCGRYYYEAEGLSPLTFSTEETNYSLCDPSRILALLQQFKCAFAKEGIRTTR